MALMLDARQRAMLAEMGITLWLPQAPGGAVETPARAGREEHDPEPAAAARAPHVPPAAASPILPRPLSAHDAALVPASDAPAALQPLQDLAALDLPGLQRAASQCQACALCAGRHHGVWEQRAAALADAGTAPAHPRWLVVTDPPGAAENASGQVLQDEAGLLLDNMLAAIRQPAGQVWRSHATKCALLPGRNVQPAELQRCAAYLQREMALVQPRVVLALGRSAAYALLGRSEPLGQLRGQPYQVQVPGLARPVPVVVSYPLGYLLRNSAAKAQAWQDMCRAHGLAAGLLHPGA